VETPDAFSTVFEVALGGCSAASVHSGASDETQGRFLMSGHNVSLLPVEDFGRHTHCVVLRRRTCPGLLASVLFSYRYWDCAV